jgi:glucose-1-phosphate thymidylyltransferase
MEQTIKVVIPMAGLGTRLRPHTWSKPKQLVSVAGKTVLDHVLDMLSTLPDTQDFELINIVGYLGDQIEDHMRKQYPNIKSHFVVQENPRGQSHAIHLAREHLTGPMMVVFADTLIETDLSDLANEEQDAIAWVKPVPDPRRFGVVVLNKDELVEKLIEKPQEIDNNLVVVGFYYFRSAEDLLSAIEVQMERDVQLKGEYFLADAINIMLEKGLKMRPEKIDIWLDAGTPEALLETNRYLLENGHNNSHELADHSSAVINPPVFVHPTAELENCVVGPFASIGARARVSSSVVSDSILEDGAQVQDVSLEKSLIGRSAQIHRQVGSVNVGDNTIVSV